MFEYDVFFCSIWYNKCNIKDQLGNNSVQPVSSEKMLSIRGILVLFISSAKDFYELLL